MSPTPQGLPHNAAPGSSARRASLPLVGSARKSAPSLHQLPASSSQPLPTVASTSRQDRPFLPLETLELSSGSEADEESDRVQGQRVLSSSPDLIPVSRPSVMGLTGAGQRTPFKGAYKAVPGQARRSAQVVASVRSRVDGALRDGERHHNVQRVDISSPAVRGGAISPWKVPSHMCVPSLLRRLQLYSCRSLPQY